MRVFHDLAAIPDDARGSSAAIGNFDGVHRGHRQVIDLARGEAPLGVVTFEPHPREVFAPDAPPFRLMNAAAKRSRLEKIGVDHLFELDFRAVAPLAADAFMSDVIAGALGLGRVVVGRDFRFGAKRAGDVDALREGGARLGFDVVVADILEGEAGAVSSTAIRAALAEGRPHDAAAMLGHWHRIEGPVIHGEKRGRTLGYPTANQDVAGLHLPRYGVYAVIADVLDGPHAGRHHGVASLGVRPMFGENRPNLETFLFDFAGDLYGATLSVALVDFVRGEARFDGVDALVAQMDADGAQARVVLAAVA